MPLQLKQLKQAKSMVTYDIEIQIHGKELNIRAPAEPAFSTQSYIATALTRATCRRSKKFLMYAFRFLANFDLSQRGRSNLNSANNEVCRRLALGAACKGSASSWGRRACRRQRVGSRHRRLLASIRAIRRLLATGSCADESSSCCPDQPSSDTATHQSTRDTSPDVDANGESPYSP